MIVIHWDFSTGYELSYQESKKKLALGNDTFSTHCLDFFSFDYNCKLVDSRRGMLTPDILLNDSDNIYTDKEIRREHNLKKMLIAGCFKGWC